MTCSRFRWRVGLHQKVEGGGSLAHAALRAIPETPYGFEQQVGEVVSGNLRCKPEGCRTPTAARLDISTPEEERLHGVRPALPHGYAERRFVVRGTFVHPQTSVEVTENGSTTAVEQGRLHLFLSVAGASPHQNHGQLRHRKAHHSSVEGRNAEKNRLLPAAQSTPSPPVEVDGPVGGGKLRGNGKYRREVLP